MAGISLGVVSPLRLQYLSDRRVWDLRGLRSVAATALVMALSHDDLLDWKTRSQEEWEEAAEWFFAQLDMGRLRELEEHLSAEFGAIEDRTVEVQQ